MKAMLLSGAILAAAICFGAPEDDFRAVLTAAKSLESELRSAKNEGQASDFDILDATLTRLRAEIALSYAVKADKSAFTRIRIDAESTLRRYESLINAKQNAGLLSKVEAARLRLRVATFRLEISEALAPAWNLN